MEIANVKRVLTNVDLAIVSGLLYTEKYLYEFGDDKEERIKWFMLVVNHALKDETSDKSLILEKINEAFSFGEDMSQNALVVISTQPCINENSDPPQLRIQKSQKRINNATHNLYKQLFEFTRKTQPQNYEQLKSWWNNGNPV